MNLPESFFKFMGYSSNDWSQLSGQVPSGSEAIYWLLKNNKISSQKYFQWAKDHYGFAYLKSDYFKSPLAASMSALLQESGAELNPELNPIPVGEWDGLTFYAGVVAPDTPLKKNERFLLAHPADLESLLPQASSASKSVEMTPPPPPVEEHDSDLENAIKSLEQNTEEAAIETPPPAPTEDLFEQLEKVAGVQSEAPPEESQPESVDVPEGLNFNFSSEVTEQAPLQDSVETSAGFEMPEGMVSFEQVSANENSDTSFEMQSQTNVNAAPVTPIASTQSSDSEKGEFEAAFNKLKTSFSESILFQYTGNQFVPVKWSHTFSPTNTVGPKDLQNPSAFRIIMKSSQAYLGHIVETDVNNDFVQNWFPNKKPEKVLLQPIYMNKNLLGCFFCICPADGKNHKLISDAEALAKILVNEWPKPALQSAA